MHSPRPHFSQRGMEFNNPYRSSLGLRDQARFPADFNQKQIHNQQFKNWFQDQFANYMNTHK
jgi:hypothetical protein